MFIDITNLRQNIGWDIELTPRLNSLLAMHYDNMVKLKPPIERQNI